MASITHTLAVIDTSRPGRVSVTLNGRVLRGVPFPTERDARAAILAAMRAQGFIPVDGDAAYLNQAQNGEPT